MPTLRWAARIAAAVIIAVSGYYMTTNYIYNKDAQPQTITVPAGQRAQITLADGTRVCSMPNPRLHMLPTSAAMTATSS